MISVPIYFNDLKQVNAESPKEMNWDVDIFPLALELLPHYRIVDFEEDML